MSCLAVRPPNLRLRPHEHEIKSKVKALALSGLTLRQIGAHLGVTGERVRQMMLRYGLEKPLTVRKFLKIRARQQQAQERSYWPTFWGNVDVRGPEECWPWLGPRFPSGYGRCTTETKSETYAHRAMLMYKLGNSWFQWALHHCDTPPCVNPEHIYAGTPTDNARDREARGRSFRHGFRMSTGPEHLCAGGCGATTTRPKWCSKRCFERIKYQANEAFRERRRASAKERYWAKRRRSKP